MAEYYPLLAKAVSPLDPDAQDARRSIYERARKALIGQLRSVSPPLAETHIDSESRALDLAIARIEAEFAVKSAIRASAQAAAQRMTRPPVAPVPAAPQLSPAQLDAAPAVAPSLTPHPPVATSPAPAVPPFAQRPPVLQPRPTVLSRALDVQPAAPVINKVAVPDVRAVPFAHSASDEALQEALADEHFRPVLRPAVAPKNARTEPVRPAASVKPEARPRNLRGLVVTLVIFAAVAAVAGAALWLKQSKDDLARIAKPLAPVADPAEVPAAPPAKSIERIGGPPPVTPDQSITPVKVPTTTLRPAPQVAPAAPIPAADSPNGTPVPPAPSIPVAHRAAILIDSPSDPQKVKTYTGTVVWRVEQVKRDGKPTATVLRADIDIPSAKVQAVITLQKNGDTTLSASHLMDLRFTIGAGGDVPGIKAIKVPELRKEETPAGEALNGAPVPVVENVFFVGLTRGDAETARNIDLLSTRNWIDIPVLLTNDKLAKITFEKGATGDRAMAEAMAAWK